MNVSANYDKILEDCKKEDLAWIEEEFDLLFKNKKCSPEDKKIVEKIIDNLMTDVNILQNEYLLVALSKTIQGIEQKYPQLF